MAERITVSTDEMRETVTQFVSAQNRLQDAYTRMDRAVRILETAWKGAAYTAMRVQWNITYRNIQQANERMQDAIDELNKTAELFDNQEAVQISSFQALDVGTSPFD